MQPAGPRPVHHFPKSSRLLKRADFRFVYDNGSRYSSRLLSAFLLDNQAAGRPPGARVGFTVPKAVGNSVARNRIRRRTREAIRLQFKEIGPTWDLVIHPRRNILGASFDEILTEVRKLIGKCPAKAAAPSG